MACYLATQDQRKDIVTKVGNVLALEIHVLSFEPSNKGGDAVLFAFVTADFDVVWNGAGERVDTSAANKVGPKGADAKQGSGHDLMAVKALPSMHLS